MGRVGMRNVYVDYLLCTQGAAVATDLSKAVDGRYSHDQITRMLCSGSMDDKKLYLQGKDFIGSKEIKGVVTLSVDDSIQPKPYSEVNGLVSYHWCHKEGRAVKGINFVSALWSDEEANVPLSLQAVEKQWVWQDKKQAYGWQAVQTKNELLREMTGRLTRNKSVDYVLSDSWYASKENMKFVYEECQTHFIMAVKENRCAARSEKQWETGQFMPLQDMKLGKRAVKLYFKDLDFPVLVVKKVFKNEDGSSGTLYLATSDSELDYEQILLLYKRRWKIEEYHKSLKTNCSLGKCQASSHVAQRSHFYLAAMAYLRLERVKVKEDKNHFALIKELNILTIRFGLKTIRQHLPKNTKNIKMAA